MRQCVIVVTLGSDDFYPSRQNKEETLIQRIDPVIHQCWTPKSPISRQEYSYFDTNGFLIMKNFFNKEQIEKLNRESEKLVQRN